jgi:hypothetical protein
MPCPLVAALGSEVLTAGRVRIHGGTKRGQAEHDPGTAFSALFARLIQEGATHRGLAVDPAVTFADLKALTAGCLAYDGPDPDRVIEVICRGLGPVSG